MYENFVFNKYYRYKCHLDRLHIPQLLPKAKSPFDNETAIILGGGRVGSSIKSVMYNHGVHLSLAATYIPEISIRSCVVESSSDLGDISFAKPYLDKILFLRSKGIDSFYRPSRRDSNRFIAYQELFTAYTYERRLTWSTILAKLDQLQTLDYIPFYRCTLILSILWAVQSGARYIHLPGVELSHNFDSKSFKTNIHRTIRFRQQHNIITLLYSLWFHLKSLDIHLFFDENCPLSVFNDSFR